MTENLFNQAIHELRQKNIAAAEKILLKLVKKKPNHAQSLNLLGLISFQEKKDINNALNFFKKSVAYGSKDINSFIFGGISAIQTGENQIAIDILEQGNTLFNHHRDIMYNLAIAYTNQKLYDLAIEMYQQCIQLNEKDYAAKINLANLYVENEDFNKAKNIFKELLNFDQSVVYKNYLSLLFKEKDYKESIQIAQKLIAKESNEENIITLLTAAVYSREYNYISELFKQYSHIDNKEFAYLKARNLININKYDIIWIYYYKGIIWRTLFYQ